MADSVEHSGEPQAVANTSYTSVFIGLGPAASSISEDQLRQRLEEVTPVFGLRIRGRSAFADVLDTDAARRLVAELSGKHIGEARMEVQLSRAKEKKDDKRDDKREDKREERDRDRERRPGGGGGTTALFVGLGPAGGAITDEQLRARLQEVAPIAGYRRRGQCVFVDVADPARADKVIQELNNQYMGDCRLSVQYSRDGKRARSGGRRRRGSRERNRGRRERNRGRRSDSRRRRRRSYSSSSSASSYSSSHDSRGHRDRRRHKRERSPSYSSASRSSSQSYRRRRR